MLSFRNWTEAISPLLQSKCFPGCSPNIIIQEIRVRLLRALAVIAPALLPFTAWAASPPDLDTAFLAAFGHKPPLVRQTFHPTFLNHVLRGEDPPWPITVQLTPDWLIPLGGSHWALIVKESIEEIGHLDGGAIAVAYLHRSGQVWTSEQIWPEVFYSGSFGQPANGGDDVKYFGPAPLYLATGEWCGMDSCSDDIAVLRLEPSGPRYLGDILGGARFPADSTDPDWGELDCEGYDVTAQVEPSRTSGAVFSVVYEGWRAPPAKLEPKTRFRYVTNMVPLKGDLAMQPAVPVPTCAR